MADAVAAFLAGGPAAGWTREPLAGDASARRYERLHGPGGATAILMDARAEPASVEPFLRVGRHLRGLGLAAPAVLAEGTGEGAGLLLLEDLGASTAADWLDRRPGDAVPLHEAAVDLLARLAREAPPRDPALVAFTPARMAGLVAPLFEHHAPQAGPRLRSALTARLGEALERHAPAPGVLALRDFHAGNLVWRGEREGLDRLGLLDFQDAVAAPAEYDLASLLRDARRDGDEGLRRAMIRRWAEETGREEARVAAAAAVLGAQRNLRILGVFAGLARGGRPGYLRHVPRLLRHLRADLAHPALAEVRPLAEAVLAPAPAEARP